MMPADNKRVSPCSAPYLLRSWWAEDGERNQESKFAADSGPADSAESADRSNYAGSGNANGERDTKLGWYYVFGVNTEHVFV